jgi:hypothetical protein
VWRKFEGGTGAEASPLLGAEGRLRCPAYFRPCVNSFPHAGHFIRSKSIGCISAGVMTFPHFGHTVLSDARTFSRLIFRDCGIWRQVRCLGPRIP